MGTTTLFALPYPEAGDSFDVPLHMKDLADALDAVLGAGFQAGDIRSSVSTTPGTGWLALNGQSVSNAESEYPALWAACPSDWRSGSNLNLPNMTDRVLMGGGTRGAAGGSNTHTLVAGNLPAHVHSMPNHTHDIAGHAHTMAHTHTGPSHSHSMSHTHGMTHGHTGSVADGGSHTHTIPTRNDPISGHLGSIGLSNAGGTIVNNRTTNTGGSHSHGVTINNFTGNTAASSAANTGASGTGNTGASSAANTGNSGTLTTANGGSGDTGNGPGTATAITHTPSHLRVNFYIKV